MSAGLDQSQSGGRYCPTCEKTFDAGERCPDDGTRLVKLQKTAADPLIGRSLDGRYTMVEQIGRGGMGAVYRATQHGLGREVAVKIVTPSLVSEPVVIKRFLREAKLASRLTHPNAVAVLDFGQTDDGLFYLVMELVKGRTLDKVIAESALAPDRVVRIGAQICDALEGAHALQIIHRDLKPANVMLMAASRDLVKVLDFGLAKSLSPEASAATMTNAGALVGTPAFMPPEAVTGGTVDARSDLYSLGCLLYTALTGRLPFMSNAVAELIAMHASEPPSPLVGVPVGLASVVMRLLAKQPSDRYADATKAREALEAALAGSKDTVRRATDPSVPRVAADANAGSSTVLGWATPSQLATSSPAMRSSAARATPAADIAMPSPASPSTTQRPTTPDTTSQQRPTSPARPAPKAVRPAMPTRSRSIALWLFALVGLLTLGAGLTFYIVQSRARANAPPLSAPPAITEPSTPTPTAGAAVPSDAAQPAASDAGAPPRPVPAHTRPTRPHAMPPPRAPNSERN